jgi:hypothetical protein
VDGNAIPLTQDFLAQMLGVRRTTVNATASLCYAVVRHKIDKIFPPARFENKRASFRKTCGCAQRLAGISAKGFHRAELVAPRPCWLDGIKTAVPVTCARAKWAMQALSATASPSMVSCGHGGSCAGPLCSASLNDSYTTQERFLFLTVLGLQSEKNKSGKIQ